MQSLPLLKAVGRAGKPCCSSAAWPPPSRSGSRRRVPPEHGAPVGCSASAAPQLRRSTRNPSISRGGAALARSTTSGHVDPSHRRGPRDLVAPLARAAIAAARPGDGETHDDRRTPQRRPAGPAAGRPRAAGAGDQERPARGRCLLKRNAEHGATRREPPRTAAAVEISSRLSGFYRRSPEDRLAAICAMGVFDDDCRQHLGAGGGLELGVADKMSENVIAIHGLPLSVALNFRVNERDVLVPMAVEEPSIVDAASNAARMVRLSGGFFGDADPPLMTAQVQLDDVPDAERAAELVRAHCQALLAAGDASIPRMVERGGGCRDLDVRVLDAAAGVLVVHVYVDVGDAMGANMVDTVAEALAGEVHALTGGHVGLRILSNLSLRRRVRVRASVSAGRGRDGVADGIARASRFAELDPCAPHDNKGFMNGLDAAAVALARTGGPSRPVLTPSPAWRGATPALHLASPRPPVWSGTPSSRWPWARWAARPGAPRVRAAMACARGRRARLAGSWPRSLAANLAALRAWPGRGSRRATSTHERKLEVPVEAPVPPAAARARSRRPSWQVASERRRAPARRRRRGRGAPRRQRRHVRRHRRALRPAQPGHVLRDRSPLAQEDGRRAAARGARRAAPRARRAGARPGHRHRRPRARRAGTPSGRGGGRRRPVARDDARRCAQGRGGRRRLAHLLHRGRRAGVALARRQLRRHLHGLRHPQRARPGAGAARDATGGAPGARVAILELASPARRAGPAGAHPHPPRRAATRALLSGARIRYCRVVARFRAGGLAELMLPPAGGLEVLPLPSGVHSVRAQYLPAGRGGFRCGEARSADTLACDERVAPARAPIAPQRTRSWRRGAPCSTRRQRAAPRHAGSRAGAAAARSSRPATGLRHDGGAGVAGVDPAGRRASARAAVAEDASLWASPASSAAARRARRSGVVLRRCGRGISTEPRPRRVHASSGAHHSCTPPVLRGDGAAAAGPPPPCSAFCVHSTPRPTARTWRLRQRRVDTTAPGAVRAGGRLPRPRTDDPHPSSSEVWRGSPRHFVFRAADRSEVGLRSWRFTLARGPHGDELESCSRRRVPWSRAVAVARRARMHRLRVQPRSACAATESMPAGRAREDSVARIAGAGQGVRLPRTRLDADRPCVPRARPPRDGHPQCLRFPSRAAMVRASAFTRRTPERLVTARRRAHLAALAAPVP